MPSSDTVEAGPTHHSPLEHENCYPLPMGQVFRLTMYPLSGRARPHLLHAINTLLRRGSWDTLRQLRYEPVGRNYLWTRWNTYKEEELKGFRKMLGAFVLDLVIDTPQMAAQRLPVACLLLDELAAVSHQRMKRVCNDWWFELIDLKSDEGGMFPLNGPGLLAGPSGLLAEPKAWKRQKVMEVFLDRWWEARLPAELFETLCWRHALPSLLHPPLTLSLGKERCRNEVERMLAPYVVEWLNRVGEMDFWRKLVAPVSKATELPPLRAMGWAYRCRQVESLLEPFWADEDLRWRKLWELEGLHALRAANRPPESRATSMIEVVAKSFITLPEQASPLLVAATLGLIARMVVADGTPRAELSQMWRDLAPGWPDMLRAAEFASLEVPGSPIGQTEPLGLEEVHGSGELRTVNDALQAIVEDAMLELSTGPHWARLSGCRQGLMNTQYRVLTL